MPANCPPDVEGDLTVDANELIYAKGVLIRLALAAKSDYALAQQVRELVLLSGILDLFGAGEDTNLFDIMEAGGADLLRARMGQMTVPQLKQIIAVRAYDPEKTTARWRSSTRFVDLIAAKASEQWEQLTLARVASAPTQRIAGSDAVAVQRYAQRNHQDHQDNEPDSEADNDPAAGAAWML